MPSAWPESLFATPLLRNLDPSARAAVEEAGRLRTLSPGTSIFTPDEIGDSFYLIHRGEVELRARTRSTIDEARLLRIARTGESFGEEAALPGARRRSQATALTPVELAEIPMALFRRALGRSGGEASDTPEQRLLRRRATADLLAQISLAETLPPDDFDLLLDATQLRERRRGERIYAVGERPDGLWLLAHGLVQLQREDPDGSVAVSAYLSDGDFFGDAELLDERPREYAAVATGACQLLFVPPASFRSLVDRNPRLVTHLRRVNAARQDRQAAAIEASPHATRHVFADLYRMRMASSLLTIDQDACVRCGHCAWSCEEVHGVARLVRRGDKVVTSLRVLDGVGGPRPRELLLPNSCQHCKNPVCMIDCPTGAIGRDPEGEVFIREELCTGCGNCAKACPWENIRMAPRSIAPGEAAREQFADSLVAAAKRKKLSLEQMFPEVATKCDLCRDYEEPACVSACPTEAIMRLEPERDFSEVAALLDLPTGEGPRASWWRRLPVSELVITALAGLGLALLGLGLGDPFKASEGPGYFAGVFAALSMLALVGHALPKRLVKRWMKPKAKRALREQLEDTAPPLPRSRVRPFYLAHLGVGLLLPGMIVLHTGPRLPASGAGLLALVAWLCLGLGLFGAASYSLVPPRLTKLEHTGALPEDLKHEHERLMDRLQRELSGTSAQLKQITASLLLPWARAPLGFVTLLASGQELGEARAQLRERVEAQLPEQLRAGSTAPRAREQLLRELEPLLRTCVELRALPARRLLSGLLRAWLGPHIMLTGALLLALLVHIVAVST